MVSRRGFARSARDWRPQVAAPNAVRRRPRWVAEVARHPPNGVDSAEGGCIRPARAPSRSSYGLHTATEEEKAAGGRDGSSEPVENDRNCAAQVVAHHRDQACELQSVRRQTAQRQGDCLSARAARSALPALRPAGLAVVSSLAALGASPKRISMMSCAVRPRCTRLCGLPGRAASAYLRGLQRPQVLSGDLRSGSDGEPVRSLGRVNTFRRSPGSGDRAFNHAGYHGASKPRVPPRRQVDPGEATPRSSPVRWATSSEPRTALGRYWARARGRTRVRMADEPSRRQVPFSTMTEAAPARAHQVLIRAWRDQLVALASFFDDFGVAPDAQSVALFLRPQPTTDVSSFERQLHDMAPTNQPWAIWKAKTDDGSYRARPASRRASGAQHRELEPRDDVVLGVHVARSGSDESVIVELRGGSGTRRVGATRR